jgi:uncharacterized protein (DUF58 family)
VLLLLAAAITALWVSPFVTGALLLAVAVAVAVDAVGARAPDVTVSLPTDLVRGLPTPFEIAVRPAPGTRVRTRQPQTAEVRFDPAEGQGSLVGTMVAHTRGAHVVQPAVTRTRGLLGLAVRTRRHGPVHTLSAHADLPGGRRIAAAVRAGTFRDPGRRRGPIGLGTDFESIRDYTPDDDVRRINWLASERAGRPMVNRYREDTEREVWCLVDAGRLLSAPIGDRTRLDLALDAVAAVAAVADVAGDRVGAVVFDDRVRRVIPPRRANAAGLVRSLDDLEPAMVDSDYDAAFGRIATAKRSLVVVFTDVLDGAAATPLLDAVPVLARRHAVLIAGVVDDDLVELVTREPDDVRDVTRAEIAADLLAERDRVRTDLTQAGAVVLDVEASTLPSACVGAYLRLKASARL